MLDAIERHFCRQLDRESSWWGLRRRKPTPDRPYTSGLLLVVCLAYGLPMAAAAWVFGYAAASLVRHGNPLADDTTWFPRAVAWVLFVFNALLNGLACWSWNRRTARLDPAAFRPPGRR